jgi:hypothetical protein
MSEAWALFFTGGLVTVCGLLIGIISRETWRRLIDVERELADLKTVLIKILSDRGGSPNGPDQS